MANNTNNLPTPSIRSRVPWAEYAALPGVSSTRLKELQHSPQKYRHFLTHNRDTAPLRLGTAAHCGVLEPERFDTDFAVWGERTDVGALRPRRGKDYDAFEAEHAGRTIITEDEHRKVLAIQDAVRGNRDAIRYLASGDPEVTMQWHSKGRAFKGRADWLTTDMSTDVLVGLKTARDCRPFIFGSAAAKLGYAIQWAIYHDGFRIITGRRPRVVEIVVESEAPHAVAVYKIPDDIIEYGRDEYERLVAILDECEANDDWPGPVIGEQFLSLPSWVYEDDGDDVGELGLELGAA